MPSRLTGLATPLALTAKGRDPQRQVMVLAGIRHAKADRDFVRKRPTLAALPAGALILACAAGLPFAASSTGVDSRPRKPSVCTHRTMAPPAPRPRIARA